MLRDDHAGYRHLSKRVRLPEPVAVVESPDYPSREFRMVDEIAAIKGRGKRAPRISPLPLPALRRIDALYECGRNKSSRTAECLVALGLERIEPLMAVTRKSSGEKRACRSHRSAAPEAKDRVLECRRGLAGLLTDSRIYDSNNSARRKHLSGGKSLLFAGSDRSAAGHAMIFSRVGIAKISDTDPRAWFADVLARLAGPRWVQLRQLLPRLRKTDSLRVQVASPAIFASGLSA